MTQSYHNINIPEGVALYLGTKTMHKLIDIRNFPKKQYICKRLQLTNQTLALICGTGYSGKTWFLQYLASCVASGSKLFGEFDIKNGTVLHIDQEQSELQTALRYTRIAGGLGITEMQTERLKLHYKLDDNELTREQLKSGLTFLMHGKTLCIIDSLKAISATDENSSQIEYIIKLLKEVAEETNCCICLVHHKGHATADRKASGRGSSAIYDSVDVQLDLEFDQKSNRFAIQCKKNRDGLLFDGLEYQMRDIGEKIEDLDCTSAIQFSLLNSQVPSAPKTLETTILELLTNAEEPMNYGQIRDCVGAGGEKLRSVVDALIAKKAINAKKQGKAVYHSISEHGKIMLGWENV